MTVNELIPKPKPPGEWVDDQRCEVCGEVYGSWSAGVSFLDGVERVRMASGNRHECGGGGFRSRGPVLWAMRVTKLELWFQRHHPCGFDVAGDVVGGLLLDGFGEVIF